MRCPSCGADSNTVEICGECGTDFLLESIELENTTLEATMNQAGGASQSQRKSSTLIEFPGVARASVPEWRKELSERVREVHERRAREAARETEAQSQSIDSIEQPQLELLPQAELPPMNPLVAAALKRIERAHRSVGVNAATAVAYAPAREDNESNDQLVVSSATEVEVQLEIEVAQSEVAPDTKHERTHGLVVVPSPEPEPESKTEPPPPPRRLIVDDDPALNYLDSISRTVRVDEIETRRASMFKRLVCGILDLIICGLLSAPVAYAMKLTGTDLRDQRAIIVMAGSAVVLAFIYFTLTTALTGRTLAMRLLSLRVIDKKTGLIPTGGQSAGRAFFYLISLAAAGLGILFVLVSREGNTVHDQFTGTSVIST
ncbi:MAG: hypothetical protein C5B55_03260 [Blastocatellia bacterium]|nr:MAG: hypothetical protein C5B55_03260 [Blastocatellia bacterium]